MSSINIDPIEVQNFANLTKKWSGDFERIEMEMKNQVQRLGASWTDSRFEQFITIIEQRSKEIKLAARQLDETSQTMRRMGERLQEEIEIQKREMGRL